MGKIFNIENFHKEWIFIVDGFYVSLVVSQMIILYFTVWWWERFCRFFDFLLDYNQWFQGRKWVVYADNDRMAAVVGTWFLCLMWESGPKRIGRI